jgi:exonuclease VII large subunit
VAEEIAYLRAKTPTAAAEILLGCFRAMRERMGQLSHQLAGLLEHRAHHAQLLLTNLPDRLEMSVRARMDRENERLVRANTALIHSAFEQIRRGELRVDEALVRLEKEMAFKLGQLELSRTMLGSKLDQAIATNMQQITQEVQSLESALMSKDPSPWMEKGWTRLESSLHRTIDSHTLKPGDELNARLKDSLLRLEVKEIIDKSTPFLSNNR